MGAEVLAATAIASTVIGAGTSIYQGVQQNNSFKAQADLTKSYADISLQESNREAARIEDEGNRFAQKQKMMYIGSGVEFGGSAIVTIAQTKKWAAAEATAQRARGAAMQEYGYQTAKIQTGQGRAALVGGFADAGRKVFDLAMAGGTGGVSGSTEAPGTEWIGSSRGVRKH